MSSTWSTLTALLSVQDVLCCFMRNHGWQKRMSDENKVRTNLRIMVADFLNKNLCQRHFYFGGDFYHAGLR
jgi:hypothetical protein